MHDVDPVPGGPDPAGSVHADADFDVERPPIAGWFGNDPIVDLRRIPEEHWVAVLERQAPRTYGMAVARIEGPDPDLARRGLVAAGQAELNRWERQARRRASLESVAHPPRLPGDAPDPVRPPDRRRQRQVNFRLTRERYGELVRAAELLNMRPTALAGLLVVRGVDQILHEADARA